MKLSEEMTRVSRYCTERLSEDANNPNFYIYQLFNECDMPASEVKRISLSEAEKLVTSQTGWHEALY